LGYIDVVEQDGTIRDTKTSGKTPAESIADKSIQLTIYAMGACAIHGEMPPKLTLDYLIYTKEPKVKIFETTRVYDDFTPILRRLENAIEVISKGAFTPAPSDSWQCSKKFCSFYSMCPYVKGDK